MTPAAWLGLFCVAVGFALGVEAGKWVGRRQGRRLALEQARGVAYAVASDFRMDNRGRSYEAAIVASEGASRVAERLTSLIDNENGTRADVPFKGGLQKPARDPGPVPTTGPAARVPSRRPTP